MTIRSFIVKVLLRGIMVFYPCRLLIVFDALTLFFDYVENARIDTTLPKPWQHVQESEYTLDSPGMKEFLLEMHKHFQFDKSQDLRMFEMCRRIFVQKREAYISTIDNVRRPTDEMRRMFSFRSLEDEMRGPSWSYIFTALRLPFQKNYTRVPMVKRDHDLEVTLVFSEKFGNLRPGNFEEVDRLLDANDHSRLFYDILMDEDDIAPPSLINEPGMQEYVMKQAIAQAALYHDNPNMARSVGWAMGAIRADWCHDNLDAFVHYRKEDDEEWIEVLDEWRHVHQLELDPILDGDLVQIAEKFFKVTRAVRRKFDNELIDQKLYDLLRFKCGIMVFKNTGVRIEDIRATCQSTYEASKLDPIVVETTVNQVYSDLVDEWIAQSIEADKRFLPVPNYVATVDRLRYSGRRCVKAFWSHKVRTFLKYALHSFFVFFAFCALVRYIITQQNITTTYLEYLITHPSEMTTNITSKLTTTTVRIVGNLSAVLLDNVLTVAFRSYSELKSQTRLVLNRTMPQSLQDLPEYQDMRNQLFNLTAKVFSEQQLGRLSHWLSNAKLPMASVISMCKETASDIASILTSLLQSNIKLLTDATLTERLEVMKTIPIVSDYFGSFTDFVKEISRNTFRPPEYIIYIQLIVGSIIVATLVFARQRYAKYIILAIMSLLLLERTSSSYKRWHLARQIEAYRLPLMKISSHSVRLSQLLKSVFSIHLGVSNIFHWISDVIMPSRVSIIMSISALVIIAGLSLVINTQIWRRVNFHIIRNSWITIHMHNVMHFIRISLSLMYMVSLSVVMESGRQVTVTHHWEIQLLIACLLHSVLTLLVASGQDSLKEMILYSPGMVLIQLGYNLYLRRSLMC